MRFLSAVAVCFPILVAVGCSETGTEAEAPPPVATKPDLVPTLLKAPELASPGRSLYVVYRYANHGDTASPAVGVHRIYLSTDTVPGEADLLLGTAPPEALGPGAFTGDSLSFLLDDGVAEGSYHVILQLDATRLITEKREDDNALSTSPPSAIKRAPDLRVDYLQMRSQADGGNTRFYVIYGFRVSNTGTAPLADYQYRVYLSKDTTLSADDIGLAGGCCYQVGRDVGDNTLIFYNHDFIKPGPYYGFIRVQPQDTTAVSDLNPSDNVGRSLLIVTIPDIGSG